VNAILQDRDGCLWFSTSGGGITRFCPPPPSPPRIVIDAVVADRRHETPSEVTITSNADLTVIEFHGASFKTRPEAIVYQHRLNDENWTTTHERRVEYHDLSPGEHIFSVRAIDRDLTYSEPATVCLTIEPDPHILALTEALSSGATPGEFVGTSPALLKLQEELVKVAETDLTLLIQGETGTGKGLAARAVHAFSKVNNGPFIQINCGGIPEGLIESELFGHERGAFTGAVVRKLGKVELAAGGTLFLDEIGDMPLDAQAKLLRVLEERTFERVGGTQSLNANARIIAATNRDLKQMVAENSFREDLYFRLHTFPVQIPPLRERLDDIPLLATYFMSRMAEHLKKTITHFTPSALSALRAYNWPGNVRELEHTVQRAVVVCHGPAIRPEDILTTFAPARGESPEEIVTLEENQRRYIRNVLETTGWVIRGNHGAANLLGIPESTLRFYMKKLSIKRPRT
jgi:transcriptional regulator with GAF, ATPase, and Fis domain